MSYTLLVKSNETQDVQTFLFYEFKKRSFSTVDKSTTGDQTFTSTEITSITSFPIKPCTRARAQPEPQIIPDNSSFFWGEEGGLASKVPLSQKRRNKNIYIGVKLLRQQELRVCQLLEALIFKSDKTFQFFSYDFPQKIFHPANRINLFLEILTSYNKGQVSLVSPPDNPALLYQFVTLLFHRDVT